MKSPEASHSFSPFALEKRLLERIQISKGMLKMRISVMELGRFTAKSSPSEAFPGLELIILHQGGERNERNCHPHSEGRVRLSSSAEVKFYLGAVMLLAFACLAII